MLPETAKVKKPAPQAIPTAILQNMNTISLGSFIAERNLTMLSAPTIPKDKMMLEVMVIIIRHVTVERPINDRLKLLEYRTPENVKFIDIVYQEPNNKDNQQGEGNINYIKSVVFVVVEKTVFY